MTLKQQITFAAKVGKLAKQFKAKVKWQNQDKTNGFGGFDNGDIALYAQEDGKVFLVCTCRNCGDGSWVNVTHMLKAIKLTK